MGITNTIAQLKDYFEEWHKKVDHGALDFSSNDVINGILTRLSNLENTIIPGLASRIAALEEAMRGITSNGHTHTINQITDLTTALNGKADGNHVHGWQLHREYWSEDNTLRHLERYNEQLRMVEARGYKFVTGIEANKTNPNRVGAFITVPKEEMYPKQALYCAGTRPGITVELAVNKDNNVTQYPIIAYSSEKYGQVYIYYHFIWSY